MTEKLTYKAIEGWAQSNGFSIDSSDGRLKAPYGEATVVIEPLARDFRVVIEHGDYRHRLITATPSKTYVDDNGMLQGAGLFTYFYTRYFDNGDDEILPVWFNKRVRVAIAERAAAARSAARQ
ncbi:hypothetical protein [Rhizobium sp. BK176]|uniref:hypothetical protein n=1 Tax=Rhizobium sp. BK176 TaxID=2587071 RepID=UPI00216A72C9|nr:hypothetical protein [Rhizobium sp. BK176]MCS4089212.1 hypothetical protein [Rhizobium sp. BK176]